MAGPMVLLALALVGSAVQAQQSAPAAPFSFAAYGDSRPMMYLPQKDGQPDLVKLFPSTAATT